LEKSEADLIAYCMKSHKPSVQLDSNEYHALALSCRSYPTVGSVNLTML